MNGLLDKPDISKSTKVALLKDLKDILGIYDDLKAGKTNLQRQIEYISSNINGHMFYPWWPSDEVDVDLDTGSVGNNDPGVHMPFEDPDGLPLLSQKQLKIFNNWERPQQALGTTELSMSDLGAETLCQDSLEDCSFVASLLSIYFYEKRIGCSLLKRNIFPQDEHGNPVVSSSGKYWVRLNVNGTVRKVVVDDRLPAPKNPRTHSLFVRSATNPGLLWPAIMEKAYLKIMGGYDFLGSYSACDTYALCSWIPEVLFINGYLQEPNASRDALWRKMYRPFTEGNVMICIGTGKMSRAESDAYGLISDHDYTVMDLREIELPDGRGHRRIVQIKNPWLSEAQPADQKLGSIQISANEAPEALYGSFWVNFDSLCLRFSSIYFNWNHERLFKHKTAINFLWNTASIEFSNRSRSYNTNPQFSLSNKGNSSENVVWLLLSRHITDKPSPSGYVSLNIYDAGGHRVYLPDEFPCLEKGTFLNTLHYLLKITIPADAVYTVVVAANEFTDSDSVVSTENTSKQYSSLRFSLMAYSLLPISLVKAREELPYKLAIDGKWSKIDNTCGGSWANDSYLNNPRFMLKVSPDFPVESFKLMVSSDSGHPINYRLYMADEVQSRNPQKMRVLGTSGEYRIGSIMSKSMVTLKPTSYLIIVSMFEPDVEGSFTIIGRGSGKFELTRLPELNAGLFKRTVQLDWNGGSRRKVRFQVNFPATANFRTQTKFSEDSTAMAAGSGFAAAGKVAFYRPHLRVSVFELVSNRLLYTNNEFTDNPFGVYLDGVQLQPGTVYVCLIERMECGHGSFEIEVYSTSPVAFTETDEEQ